MSGSNFHTHTVFCDGRDTPEELVLYAISQGCGAIGFSGHSHIEGIPDSDQWCMSAEGAAGYKNEIRRLKEAYGDRIDIYLGMEQDYFSGERDADLEYAIGSVHYVLKDGAYIPVDESRDSQIRDVNRYYGGDFLAFAEDYYALVGDVYKRTKCDIIGHFDLVTKFNEGDCLFDTSDPRYVRAADAALEKLIGEDVVFEINYGAIARGYRSDPYPDARILKEIEEAGGRVMHTSDCHDKEMLLLGIPDGETPWMPRK